ncbi:hypothetical protein VLK81_00475 [Citroniella saccharovorans]|uniref:Uncharacterized protein n=1 Tax=Citroniella saccharovorans TaxID=2053367 RepID=A0AAW9MQY7_9FIRM|nr:hypothetical protein [Citroniella saccharovorans]MEB3428531.1 hypothetical protein [Citroniella saccharovorans]
MVRRSFNSNGKSRKARRKIEEMDNRRSPTIPEKYFYKFYL